MKFNFGEGTMKGKKGKKKTKKKRVTGYETVTVAFSDLPPGEKFTKGMAVFQKKGWRHAVTGDGDGLKKVRFEDHWQCTIAAHRLSALGLGEEDCQGAHPNDPYVKGDNEPSVGLIMLDPERKFIYLWRMESPLFQRNEFWAGIDYKSRVANHVFRVNGRTRDPGGREFAGGGSTWKSLFGSVPRWLKPGKVFLVRYVYLGGKPPERILDDPVCTCA
jgi:hypothetical protein